MRQAVGELIGKGIPVKEIDVDKSPTLAARYYVTEVPTFIVADPDGNLLCFAGKA